MMTSSILRYGAKHLVRVRSHIEEWLEKNHHESLRAIQGRIWSLDGKLSISEIRTMDQLIDRELAAAH